MFFRICNKTEMCVFRISCLLFMCILTSLSKGENDSDFTRLKKSTDVFLTFKPTQKLPNLLNDEEVVDEIRELAANNIYYLNIESVPDWVQFIILQVHVYTHNVTLGYNIVKVPHKYVVGQNIGLAQNISTTGTAQFFLENENPFNVTVLIAAVAYNNNAPVPGGCNMEFDVETAPWLKVIENGAMVTVENQPSRMPRTWGFGGTCDNPSLQYQAFHLYLPEKDFSKETYFDFLRKMMTVKRIMKNGRMVADIPGSAMRHGYSAYHGTGSVYAVVAYANSQYAAYVPAFTYTCSPAHYTDSCQVLTSAFSRTLCALVLFIGLFVCFYGHSFFQTELFLLSTLAGGIISYVLFAGQGFTDSTNVLLATAGGVVVGNLWLVFWWLSGAPIISLLVATLNLGYLFASLFFYTPLADIPYMRSDVNFWLAFVCLMLVIGVIVVPQANKANILACSSVGSYAAIVPIDHYVGANLKYIFINPLRRATVSGFNEAIIDPPYQTKDLILAGIWLVLAVSGYVLQSQRFVARPPYPRSPHAWSCHSSSPSRTPLLSEDQPPTTYGGVPTPGSDNVFT